MTSANPQAIPAACYHCGLPLAAQCDYRVRILGHERQMCCPGCQAVAQSIVEAGLESYYRHRSEASTNPQALPALIPEELRLFDRDDVQRGFVQHDGPQSQAQLMIEGISCAACGWLVERHLRQSPGVLEASFNLSNHRLSLTWDSHLTALSELLTSLRRIGYVAHPWLPDQVSLRLHQENRQALRRLGMAGLLWMQVMMAGMATWPEFNLDLSTGMDRLLRWVSLLLTTPIVFYCCMPFLRGALRDLRTRRLTMDVSVSLAIVGAYLAGILSTVSGQGELYFDTVGMFALFLLAGRYLERRARERTAAATAQLVNLLPSSCLRLDQSRQTQRVLLSDLRLGDQVQVAAGATLPADGVILQGCSRVDESLLTGEYMPQPRHRGDRVTAGTLNVESELVIEVQALGAETRLSAIVRLLERAQGEKPSIAQLADRVAQYFLLFILLAAAVVGLVWWQLDSQRAFWVVLSLLVATCPCALSLATPTALTTATGTLHKAGVLLTRGHVLESLAHIDCVVFDKTGTLTEGRLVLNAIHSLAGLDSQACLALAAALESHSQHPIARAFGHSPQPAEDVQAYPGQGLQGRVGERCLRIGQADFVCQLSGQPPPAIPGQQGQWLLLGDLQGPLAWLVLDDRLREDAPALLDACRRQGWQTLLLSGDTSPMVADVAAQLGLDRAVGGLSPEGKLQEVRRLQQQGLRVMMVGDGVNDVPVLAAADIGIAMGSATDLTKTSADAVLLSNRLDSLVTAFALARRTRRIIIENLGWAGLYNAMVLPFAALGWITPFWAALGMSLSSLLVVLNALRLRR